MSARWHPARMDDLAIGRVLRALRHRLRLRQVDIATRSNVSQSLVSRMERGRLDEISRGTIRRVFASLDADVVTVVRWRGGQLDRLLDERHADIVGRMSAMLRRDGWEVIPEATFSEFGERGSIDLLAWHPGTRTLLVVEIKTEIASAEELLRRHDVKVRLAPKVAPERFGERPAVVARLLVIADSSTNRRRLNRLEPVVGAAYPARGGEVRRWLRSPAGAMAGVIFVSGSRDVPPGTGGSARVRRSRARRRE
jgi:transcriptional regulator with XRE-family HTH domain